MTNLIDNALRVSPASGLVTVAVFAGALIEVRDHGPGVALADRPHVFEPFWRKEHLGPGTGLGLSIVQEVARLHGGTAWVDETPGGGATFSTAAAGTLHTQGSPSNKTSCSRNVGPTECPWLRVGRDVC